MLEEQIVKSKCMIIYLGRNNNSSKSVKHFFRLASPLKHRKISLIYREINGGLIPLHDQRFVDKITIDDANSTSGCRQVNIVTMVLVYPNNPCSVVSSHVHLTKSISTKEAHFNIWLPCHSITPASGWNLSRFSYSLVVNRSFAIYLLALTVVGHIVFYIVQWSMEWKNYFYLIKRFIVTGLFDMWNGVY